MNTNRSIRWLIFRITIFSVLILSLSAASFAQIAVVSVRFGPPAIPVYAQPLCPGSGYFWTPGYWAWDDYNGYYWVPGTWVVAPVGLLWTPGYWGWGDGFYRWNPGYWGPHVGFYGGINYGFGYGGVGFWGGEWRGDRFFYNRSVTNINIVNVTNVYERRVVVNNTNRVSYNGGSGGINARPNEEEERYSRESHREALADQVHHERAASQNRELFASKNHGRPAIAATGRPGEFRGHDVVAAKQAGAPYHPPKISPQQARGSSSENRDSERRNEQRKAENRRETARPENRKEQKRDVTRDNSKQQAKQEKADQRRAQEQSRQEQKQQQQAQKAERKQAPQAQREKADQRRAQEQSRQEQKQQQQAQKAERKQAPQAQREKTDQRRAQEQSRQDQRRQQQAQQGERRQAQQAQKTERKQAQQAKKKQQQEQKRGTREERGPGH